MLVSKQITYRLTIYIIPELQNVSRVYSVPNGGSKVQSWHALIEYGITSRTLYFMPGNVVCRLQMSTNRHVAGAPPQTPLGQLIYSAPTDPLTGGEWVQTFPQTQPSSGLGLWPLNIFSGSASGRTSLFWRPVSPKSSFKMHVVESVCG